MAKWLGKDVERAEFDVFFAFATAPHQPLAGRHCAHAHSLRGTPGATDPLEDRLNRPPVVDDFQKKSIEIVDSSKATHPLQL